jgi:hypothetical protein
MTETIATPDIHNAFPQAARGHFLRLSVNELLRKNLRQAIEAAQSVFPFQTKLALAAVEGLDTARHIAPEIFVFHWQMTSALREQDTALVSATLASLALAAERGHLHTDDISISNLPRDAIDAASAHYLCRPGGPRGSEGQISEMLPLNGSDYNELTIAAREALTLLAQASPEMYGEFLELATSVRLFEQKFVGSMSSPRSFGVMHICKPGEQDDLPLYYLNNITHETSHIALNAVMTQGQLILNDPSERFSSPLRPDARPMDGIYHAAFVLSRIALVQSQPVVKQRPATAQLQENTLNFFWAAYKTITEEGKLTEAGHKVIESCREVVDSI